jgi:hypothetical protein
MGKYIAHHLNLTGRQFHNLSNGRAIQLHSGNYKRGYGNLHLTRNQAVKLRKKAMQGCGMKLKLSHSQLKHHFRHAGGFWDKVKNAAKSVAKIVAKPALDLASKHLKSKLADSKYGKYIPQDLIDKGVEHLHSKIGGSKASESAPIPSVPADIPIPPPVAPKQMDQPLPPPESVPDAPPMSSIPDAPAMNIPSAPPMAPPMSAPKAPKLSKPAAKKAPPPVDSRDELLSAIRGGAKLRKAQPSAPKSAPAPAVGSRDAFLDSIRGGVSLKKTETNKRKEAEPVSKGPPMNASLYDSISSHLANRRQQVADDDWEGGGFRMKRRRR